MRGILLFVLMGAMGAECATPSFASPVVLDADSGALGTAAGDLDGDGNDEFVSISSGEATDECFQIYDWNGSTWDTYEVLTEAQVAAKLDRFGTGIAVGDVDDDGDLDLITIDSSNSGNTGALVWYSNPGTLGGSWTENEDDTFSGTGTGNQITHADVVAGDIDADGFVDVVARDISHGTWVWMNDGLGGFEARNFTAHNAREGVALEDVDADGDLDVWINGAWLQTPSDPQAGSYTLREPTGVDTNWYPSSNGTTEINHWACKVAVGDFDQDGDPDMVISNAEELFSASSTKPEGIAVYIAPADPVSGSWTEVDLRTARAAWHGLAVADFNQDGWDDVIASIGNVGNDGGSPFETVLFLNDQDNTFTEQSIQTTVAGYQLVLGDFDGDGDQDFIMAQDYNANALRLYENTTPVAVTGRAASVTISGTLQVGP